MKTRYSSMEEIADKIHLQARLSLVSNFSNKEQSLIGIYGHKFNKAESFPLPENKEFVAYVLSILNLRKSDNPLVIEEYRRLERVLNYKRKVFCLDLEGLIIDNNEQVPGIKEAIRTIRKKHNIVISTAMPENEAIELLAEKDLADISFLIFGDLSHPKGKKYNQIAEFFSYAHPENHLVAVGHSFEDVPADINIPFMYLDVPKEQLYQALIESSEFLSGKDPKHFEIIQGSLDTKIKDKFFLVTTR